MLAAVGASMRIWLLHLIPICLVLCCKKVSADAIRGVNLGGWLLTEEWYVAKVPLYDRLLTHTQDNALAFPLHRN